ncbi:hypothetical protein AAFF_G00335550 [Aldrovandia affinis]|uniref:Uncharacterized protein n=1 Tax=Aldrovandia affinis TaxID=143900 RepID=A0AAD7SMF0_9TELE|nr:hypothetical protein AAFF_G00335550 [Aldrovandia affinis]
MNRPTRASEPLRIPALQESQGAGGGSFARDGGHEVPECRGTAPTRARRPHGLPRPSRNVSTGAAPAQDVNVGRHGAPGPCHRAAQQTVDHTSRPTPTRSASPPLPSPAALSSPQPLA